MAARPALLPDLRSARITGLWLTAFKSFRDVVMPLEPLTVLIGRNGSGKSNALDGLDVLRRLAVVGDVRDALEERRIVDVAEELVAVLGGLFHFDPVPYLMRRYVPEHDVVLRTTGENLSAALAHPRDTDARAFSRLVSVVKELPEQTVVDAEVRSGGLVRSCSDSSRPTVTTSSRCLPVSSATACSE